MLRAAFACTLFALPAWADDFTLQAPVTEAEIFLGGAIVTREAGLDLPAGQHRLLIPHVIDGAVPLIEVTGATMGPVQIVPDAIVDGREALTEGQRAAYDAWQDALRSSAAADDARLRAGAALAAAEDALRVLRSMSGGSLETLEPDAVGPFVAAVSSNITAAELARAEARLAVREADRVLRDANLSAEQAKRDFEATGGRLDTVSMTAIGIDVAEAGPVSVRIEAFARNASWAPRYDVTLGEDDAVTIDRKVAVRQGVGLPFVDVALTLSTSDPYAQRAPQPVPPNQAILEDFATSSFDSRGSVAELEAPLAREMAVAEEAPVRQALTANFEGAVVTYDYPSPVTLAPDGSETLLALDSVSLAARVFNRASVRWDRTAFLMAELTNTLGEPLLPGQATFYRQDARIGETFLPLIPAGDEAELSFGPQQFLRVEFVLLENEEGDTGLFTTSGTRRQDMVFRIRNLSGEAAEVEARYALPYSEDEDLEIAISARPEPTTRDVDDGRGVAEWALDVPPGDEASVAIGVALRWPEGQTLIWSP